MIEQTQTSLYPRGNCWQTAVACLLEVPAEELPSQADSYYEDTRVDGSTAFRMSYNNRLQAYLKKHHALAYVEFHIPFEAYKSLRIDGYHLMSGTTVRSVEYDGQRHMVVGHNGTVVWDPHPSRAGLLGDISWALICPFPAAWGKGPEMTCVCPKCPPLTTSA